LRTVTSITVPSMRDGRRSLPVAANSVRPRATSQRRLPSGWTHRTSALKRPSPELRVLPLDADRIRPRLSVPPAAAA